jgi:hypothetical protein
MKHLQEGVEVLGVGVSFCGVRIAKVSTEYRNILTAKVMVNSLCTPWRHVGMEVSLQSLLTLALDRG